MRITTRRMLALVLAGMLALAACGDAPDDEDDDAAAPTDDEATADDDDATDDDATDDDTEPPAETVDFRGCLVTDAGGVDDRSFNETAYNGLLQAEEELGIETAVLESSAETDYEPNVQAFLDQDCDLIITVGFLLGDVTAAAAEANPDQNFAIVDVDFFDFDAGEDVTFDNARELTFQTDEAAFLAGYVAAAMTESGTVGTYGGINIPTVSIFMDGYLAGVNYYNQENGTDVAVEGWDGSDGLFTGTFDEVAEGRNVTDSLLQAGADIIMPVAGPVGEGTATAIQDFGSGTMIWVDTDGFESTQYGELILTSVEKKMDVAVFDTVQAAVEDQFEGGLYIGTLENDGVAISPFHDFEDQVPDEVKSAIDELIAGIIAGEISVDPADY